MARRLTSLAGAIALALLAGCGSPTSSTVSGEGSDTGPAGPGLTVHILADDIVFYAMPSKAGTQVIDYVVLADKTNEIVTHLENASNMNNFRQPISRQQMPKGVYHVKVYADKATEPFDTKDVVTP